MNIRGMNEGNQHATYCIYNNMMFPTLDFFPTIESRFFGGFGGSLHALAVDDPSGRFFVPTVVFRSIRRISWFTRSKARTSAIFDNDNSRWLAAENHVVNTPTDSPFCDITDGIPDPP